MPWAAQVSWMSDSYCVSGFPYSRILRPIGGFWCELTTHCVCCAILCLDSVLVELSTVRWDPCVFEVVSAFGK